MDSFQKLIGLPVIGNDGEKIGKIDGLYVTDDQAAEPTFITVSTGWFSGSSFVPISNVQINEDSVVVPYDKDKIKEAPNVEADKELTPEEENRLYSYYQAGGGVAASGQAEESESGAAYGQSSYDVSGPTTDNAMTRSEEQIRVGTRTEETGRVRLRKYVVTENVTQTVPVQREVVRVETEPITEENIGDALDGPAISNEEHEVVTHAEVPVVEKKVVPVERVKLTTDVVKDEAVVSEEVRKEQIDLDDDIRRG